MQSELLLMVSLFVKFIQICYNNILCRQDVNVLETKKEKRTHLYVYNTFNNRN